MRGFESRLFVGRTDILVEGDPVDETMKSASEKTENSLDRIDEELEELALGFPELVDDEGDEVDKKDSHDVSEDGIIPELSEHVERITVFLESHSGEDGIRDGSSEEVDDLLVVGSLWEDDLTDAIWKNLVEDVLCYIGRRSNDRLGSSREG